MSAPNIVLKPGAYMILGNLDAASINILRAIASTAPPLHDNELWITSAADRRRGIGVVNSLHPAGQAWDFRTQPGTGGRPRAGMVIANGPADRLEKCRFWADRARHLLGPDYDIVVEADHLHAEYDPKPPPVALTERKQPVDLLFKSKTVIGVLIVVLAWVLGPESEPLKVLPQSLVDSATALGSMLGAVGLRDALRKLS